MKLENYNHSLEGKIVTRDDGNWTRQGRWHKDKYIIRGNEAHGVARHFYWNNVAGPVESIEGEVLPVDVDCDRILIAGIYVCDRPEDCIEKPLQKCEEPDLHIYHFEARGRSFKKEFDFCGIADANREWGEFADIHGIKLAYVKRDLI